MAAWTRTPIRHCDLRHTGQHIVVKVLVASISIFCASTAVNVLAGEPPRNGHDTIEDLFEAYKKAMNDRDWDSLFLLGTAEYQNAAIFQLVVNAAISNDHSTVNGQTTEEERCLKGPRS